MPFDPLLDIALGAGIDESQREELLDPSAAFILRENVRSRSRGAAEKRRGFATHLPLLRVDGTSRSAGYRQFADGKKTCVIDRDVLDVYSPDNEDQISRGRVPECGLSMMKVPAPPGSGALTCTDSVRVGDYLALAYTASNSVYAAVVEAETGQVIIAPTLIYTGSAETYGLLGSRGSTAMIFIACSGEPEIRYSEVDCSTATTAYAGWSGVVNDVSDNITFGGLSMAVHSIGSRVYMAYVNDSAGASQLTVLMYSAGTSSSTTINTSSATPTDIALGGASGDTLWVAWNESTSVNVCGLSPTNLSSVLATTATVITASVAPNFDGIAVVASSTAGAGRLFVNDGGNDRLFTRNFTTDTGAVSPSGSTVTAFNVQMAGRPFRVGSRYYGVCRGVDATEKVAILCDLTESNAWVRPVANVAPRLAQSFHTCQAAQHSTREFWSPIGIQTAGNVVSVQMARFDFDAPFRWRPVAHNGVTFLSGGLLSFFDGVRVAEASFVIRPPAPTLATNGAGTFSSAIGVRVVAVYEQVDSAGNWHVSGVSDAAFSGAFSNIVNLEVTVRPLAISGRISTASDPTVRISLYATANGGAAPYYYVTSLTNTLTGSTQTHNITEHVTGSTAMLYAPSLPGVDGSAQDRRAPCGLTCLTSYNGILVGSQGEVVYHSGQDVDGEGTWFNPVFSLPVSGGGEITALESQDGTLFVFKRDRIFAVSGEPPSDNGSSGGLGTPQRLAVDTGAISPITCVTQHGILFVSDRGLALLTRARTVEYIGDQIQDTFEDYPHVTAMTYDPISSCVYVECASGFSAGLATGSGRTFVFDTVARSWQSIDRRAVSASADVPAQDGCLLWTGNEWRYGWLRSTGVVYTESESGEYLDEGDVWITQRVVSGWIKVGGLQGEQLIERLLLLCERHTAHDLTISLGFDYETSYSESHTFTNATLSALSRQWLEKQVVRSRSCQAIRVKIEDATPTTGDIGTGRGATWIGMTFTGERRAGAKRTYSAQRGG